MAPRDRRPLRPHEHGARAAAHLMRKRNRRGRHRRRGRVSLIALVVVVLAAVGVVAAGIGAGTALSASCDLSSLHPVAIGQNSFVYAADGSLLGAIPAERNREPVALDRISPWLPKATVAVEDRRFYQHGGVDYEGIARALWKDVSAGKVVEGGSTIAQQLVAQPLHGPRTYVRAQAEGSVPRRQAEPAVVEDSTSSARI